MGINVFIKFISYLFLILKKSLKKILIFKNEITLVIFKKYNIEVISFLKNHILTQYKSFIDITAVDFLKKFNRFNIIYQLLSIQYNSRICVQAATDNQIASIVSLYKGAIWAERETWDMFGIFFFNNPDLRRILTDYGFQGFPLRKNFPINGFVELRYDDIERSVVYENIELTQEFRFFNFLSPWDSISNFKLN